jgi:hypothetical protein
MYIHYDIEGWGSQSPLGNRRAAGGARGKAIAKAGQMRSTARTVNLRVTNAGYTISQLHLLPITRPLAGRNRSCLPAQRLDDPHPRRTRILCLLHAEPVKHATIGRDGQADTYPSSPKRNGLPLRIWSLEAGLLLLLPGPQQGDKSQGKQTAQAGQPSPLLLLGRLRRRGLACFLFWRGRFRRGGDALRRRAQAGDTGSLRADVQHAAVGREGQLLNCRTE